MTIKVTYNVTDVYVTQDVSPVYINVSYSGSSSGSAVWGGITGTLSNQTDLQNALNAKYNNPTGTTSQYLRGDGSLATFPAIPSGTVTSVGLTMPSAFSVANSPITSSGTLAVTATGDTTQYIAGDGSLVAFPITGQAGTLVREVRNVTGATLTKGTVVYINGASGNKPTVAKALATGDATSAQTFGLIQADIPNNSNGYLVAFGDLDGLNTSAFAEGVQLYLSSTTAGGYTSTKQYAPNHLVYIGVVTRQHVNQGRIEVRIQNGYEMDELHDVAAQTPSNNHGLFYNSTNSLWENKSISTALGYTPANAATTLTINGVTFDLSANRTFTVGSVTGSGAAGQVAYWTGTSAQSGSNNLFWDATNSRLGIGTTSPDFSLVVASAGNSSFKVNPGVNSVDFISTSSLALHFVNDFTFFYGSPGSAVNKMKLYGATGNLTIGGASDVGYKLDVSGTTRITGQNLDLTNNLAILKMGTTNTCSFEMQSVGALAIKNGSLTKFFIGSSTVTGIEIPIEYSIAFVNPGVAGYGNINWNNSVSAFEFKNFAKTAFSAVNIGKLSLSAGTTASSQINLASSTAPTSPNDGDIWFDGTNIKMRIGGVTKTFTLI